MSTGAKKNPLTEIEKKYILENYKTTTVPVMAKYLRRGFVMLYAFLDDNGLQNFNPNYQGAKRLFIDRKIFFDETVRSNWLI